MEESVKNRPMRILMTADTIGGVWSYAIELCKALGKYDVHFNLVCTGAAMQPHQQEEVGELENVTVYDKGFLLEWMESPWKSIEEAGAWLLQLEDEVKPDLVHLNCYAYGSLPWKAPVIVVAHSDVWSWWLEVKKVHPPGEWNRYYNTVKSGLKGADLIIAPSGTMMNYIRSIYNFSNPGNIIYNGRSADSFKPADKEGFIFSMGRIWDEAKNIRLLADASVQVPYPIKLAGDSSFEKNKVTTIGEGNIACLGKLSMQEVAENLSRASVYVLPAKYEPFGLSVLEAALSGCALLLGNIASLKEIWNENAMYVDTDDADALAKTINQLICDDVLCREYGGKALRHAASYSTIEMSKNYLNAYSNLLQQQ